MPRMITTLLDSRVLWFLARLLLAVVFLSSGLAKLLAWDNSVAEMQAAGLQPPVLFNLASAVVLLGGVLCLLLDRLLWLGSGALAVFMLLTIAVVHTFWTKHGAEQQLALFFALEHLSVVGGLICAAIASHARAQKNSSSNR
ncbi:DoxX family protein [Stenotrophomonas hibiscicola]|uniref:DoxX family protein n=1 Tax=Stenotrophomonas hibiscicola TaxID=86189 RepID=A0ABV0C540_9GAMM|nr:DoxX family protein [[Pseudomonas] hibiscicola]MBH1444125.1 DoxX family protein [Stenotrophomonas maltophilia]MBN7851148.1 DoxX family protein [Stenotrophomonas maltophilia]UXB25838.1 DoxX family protein [Stenotrophomonas maltophilia]UXB41943.1 DoxX family protein [Stenotrophomonas maltophilia]